MTTEFPARIKPIVACVAFAALLFACGDSSVGDSNTTNTNTTSPTTDQGDATTGADTTSGDTDDDGDTGGTGDATGNGDATDPSDTTTTTNTGMDTGGGVDVPPQPMVTSVRIEPAVVRIDTELGVPATAQLELWADYDDGSSEAITGVVQWTSEEPLVADVDGAGLVTTATQLGATTVVTANWGSQSASRDVTVALTQTTTTMGLDPNTVIPALDGGTFGDPNAGPIWTYPENETMFPAGVLPPVIQWSRNGNQYFTLSLTRDQGTSFTIYTDQNEYQPTQAQWDALAAGYGDPITLNIVGKQTLDPTAQKFGGQTLVFFTADANLSGSVYYWEVDTGSILRIDEGATSPTPVFQDTQCRGCHALSRDGSKLGFMYNGGGDPQAGLAYTSAPDPALVANTPGQAGRQWDFLTFDPSGDRVASVYYGNMSLWDASPTAADSLALIAPVPQANQDSAGMPSGALATMPTWSPDGSTLAFVRRWDGGTADWAIGDSDLMTMQWDGATETFSLPTMLRAAADTATDPTSDTISYPTWSPDSRWLGVGVGPTNRSPTDMRIEVLDPTTGVGHEMTRGAPTGGDVFPSFSPFIEGGYYWMLFYSGRPYGHRSTQKQLWVMAIDQNFDGTFDGSHPAFWLPGQDTAHINITGYWAPSPCAGSGQSCSASSECCGGLTCTPDGMGGSTCEAQDSCSLPGTACETSADCCASDQLYMCMPNLAGDDVCQLVVN